MISSGWDAGVPQETLIIVHGKSNAGALPWNLIGRWFCIRSLCELACFLASEDSSYIIR